MTQHKYIAKRRRPIQLDLSLVKEKRVNQNLHESNSTSTGRSQVSTFPNRCLLPYQDPLTLSRDQRRQLNKQGSDIIFNWGENTVCFKSQTAYQQSINEIAFWKTRMSMSWDKWAYDTPEISRNTLLSSAIEIDKNMNDPYITQRLLKQLEKRYRDCPLDYSDKNNFLKMWICKIALTLLDTPLLPAVAPKSYKRLVTTPPSEITESDKEDVASCLRQELAQIAPAIRTDTELLDHLNIQYTKHEAKINTLNTQLDTQPILSQELTEKLLSYYKINSDYCYFFIQIIHKMKSNDVSSLLSIEQHHTRNYWTKKHQKNLDRYKAFSIDRLENALNREIPLSIKKMDMAPQPGQKVTVFDQNLHWLRERHNVEKEWAINNQKQTPLIAALEQDVAQAIQSNNIDRMIAMLDTLDEQFNKQAVSLIEKDEIQCLAIALLQKEAAFWHYRSLPFNGYSARWEGGRDPYIEKELRSSLDPRVYGLEFGT